MVRVGGMGYTINVDAPMGSRISNMHLLGYRRADRAGKDYVVAGWGSVNEDVEGPPIWDVVARPSQGPPALLRRSRASRQDRACLALTVNILR